MGIVFWNKTAPAIVGAVITVSVLSSCSFQEIFSDTVETEISRSWQNAQKPKGSHPNAKQQAKEAEQLKQEGKCPTCRGVGKTPDGRYTCTVCNGTGQFKEKTE